MKLACFLTPELTGSSYEGRQKSLSNGAPLANNIYSAIIRI